MNAVFGTIYGKNTLDHIITGKAISRAIRGHFLVGAALNLTLITQLFPGCFLDNESDFEDESNTSTLFKELRQLLSGESTCDEVCRSKAILQ